MLCCANSEGSTFNKNRPSVDPSVDSCKRALSFAESYKLAKLLLRWTTLAGSQSLGSFAAVKGCQLCSPLAKRLLRWALSFAESLGSFAAVTTLMGSPLRCANSEDRVLDSYDCYAIVLLCRGVVTLQKHRSRS